MKVIWQLRPYLAMFRRRYVIAIVALQVVALLNLLPSWLIGRIVDSISQQTLTANYLTIHITAILGAAFAMYGLRYVWQSQLYGASVGITHVLRSELFDHFSRLSPSFYARNSTGDLMAHATNDLNAVEEAAGMGIMTLVDSLIAGLTVIAGMVLVVNGELTAIALLPFPLLVLMTRRYGKYLHRSFSAAQAAFSHINEQARETVSGIRAVRSHGIASRQQQRFEQALDDTLTSNYQVAKVESAFAPTIQIIYGLSFVMSLSYGAWLIERGEITVGLFTTFTLYLAQLLGPFLQFGWQFNVFQRGSTSWQRLRTLFKQQSDVQQGSTVLPKNAKPRLAFDIKSFIYQGANRRSLEDIRFEVPTGGLVGITGPTGGGKSTLLHLLLRQFPLEAHSGISIDGYPIENLTFASLRSRLGWVAQKPLLFSGSIVENVAFAQPDASQDDIRHACKMAGILAEIEAMPDGFNTLLREGGSNLSGGQRQRLTLARALLSGADVLLLDDPFSALDMKTELQIRNNLAKYYPDKTILLVTQRLNNLIDADLTLVLQQGQIVEQGTHCELLAQRGWYAEVFQQQSQSHGELSHG